MFRPSLPTRCDWDFGASANVGVTARGSPPSSGVGGKDGTYYSFDPATGRLRWATNVVFGGFSGGFVATTAFDGQQVYGSTALGDFGRIEKDSQVLCDPIPPGHGQTGADRARLQRHQRRRCLAGRDNAPSRPPPWPAA